MIFRTKLKSKKDHFELIHFKDAIFIKESKDPGYKYLHYLCRRLVKRPADSFLMDF